MMEIVTSIVLLFLGIAILVTIHVCIVGRGFGNSNTNQRGRGVIMTTTSASMSEDEIKKLPCFDYNKEEEERVNGGRKMSDCCAVCLENFKVGDKCRLLPKCNHSFHAHCIDSWLVKTGACPVCRTGADAC